MKISQAIICASGKGLRLKMGSKPYIIYKNKFLLEYCIISCLNANIKNIVITIPPKSNLEKNKLVMLSRLIKTYPKIKFVYDNEQKGFRSQADYVRNHLDQKLPFYLLTGHSPQSSLFLKKLASLYRKQEIVSSGYQYRYEKKAAIATVCKNKIKDCKFFGSTSRPRIFRPSFKKQFITSECEQNLIIGSPYILNYDFYDRCIKKDNCSYWIEYYFYKFIKDGNVTYCAENFDNISEIDYKRDFPRALEIIDQLSFNEVGYL